MKSKKKMLFCYVNTWHRHRFNTYIYYSATFSILFGISP